MSVFEWAMNGGGLLAQSGGTGVPSAGGAALGGGAVLVFGCMFALLGLAMFAFWIWMLIDCVQRDYGNDNSEKIVWVLVIVLAQILGAIIYFFVGRSRGVKPGESADVSVVDEY